MFRKKKKENKLMGINIAKSDFSCVETRFFPGSRHCASAPQMQVLKLCTDLEIQSTFCYLEHIANLLEKIISKRLAFVFRSPARELAAGVLRQDHVYKTTDESFHFHNKQIDEMRCKLDSTENLRSFEKYPTLP